MDTSLLLETKEGSRWRWIGTLEESEDLFITGLHLGSGQVGLSPMVIPPVWFLSLIWFFWHACLCSYRHRNCVFASTNSSWLSRPARAGFCPVSLLTSLCSGPTDEKSSFYEEDCGLYFFHFVLLDIVALEALLNRAEKFIPSNTFSLKLIT